MAAPNVQPIIDAAWATVEADLAAKTALLAATEAERARLQAVVEGLGPMFFSNWDETKAGTPVDLAGYVETFRDNFDAMSIVNSGQTGGKWYAGPGTHTSFGDASFKPVGSAIDPYLIANGECRIRMEKIVNPTTGTASWQSGLIQTVDAKGVGFSQAGGYFEARMKFPTNGQGNLANVKGAWPAFWLLSNDAVLPTTKTRMEFDIVEAYGSDPAGLHATVHYKPAPVLAPGAFAARQTKANYVGLKSVKNLAGNKALIWGANGNMFNGEWKTYGVMFGDTIIQIFVDGLEVCRFPTQPWMLTPVYILVNLAMNGSEKSTAPSPQDMSIDYVRAMAR